MSCYYITLYCVRSAHLCDVVSTSLLSEALFGQAPFASETMEQLLEKIATEQVITVSTLQLGMGIWNGNGNLNWEWKSTGNGNLN